MPLESERTSSMSAPSYTCTNICTNTCVYTCVVCVHTLCLIDQNLKSVEFETVKKGPGEAKSSF